MNLRSFACCTAVVIASLGVLGWAGNNGTAEFGVLQGTEHAATLTSEQTGPYFALLIGINDYEHLPKLKTAVHDAESMAALLHDRYGFETNILRNPTRDQVKRALNVYRRELEHDSNLLIYYAGHGFYDKEADKAYWLPADAERGDTTNWIIADEITTDAKVMPARHVLIVSDSCYSGGITRGLNAEFISQDSQRYLTKMVEGKSRTLMASGGLEPVADQGGHGHSVFAAALIDALTKEDEPAFSAQILFEHSIRLTVSGRSEQTPEYNVIRNSGHNAGDFVFLRSGQARAPETTVASTKAPPPSGGRAAKPEPAAEREAEGDAASTRAAPAVDEPPAPADAAPETGAVRSPGPLPGPAPDSEPVNAPATELPTAVATTTTRPEFQAMKLSFTAGMAAMNIARQISATIKTLPPEERTEMYPKRVASCGVAAARFQDAEHAAPREDAANVMSVAASNHAIVWANLGLAYECLSRYEDAVVAFHHAAALRPQANYYAHLSADTARGAIATHDPETIQKRTARANLNCERAAAIDPAAGATCWKNLGIIYYKSLSVKQAVPALRKAVEADPDDAQAWYVLGSALAAHITSRREGDQTVYTIPGGTRRAYQRCIAAD